MKQFVDMSSWKKNNKFHGQSDISEDLFENSDGQRGPAWAAYRMFDKDFSDFSHLGYSALNCPQCGCTFEEKEASECGEYRVLVDNECLCVDKMVESRNICVCQDGYLMNGDSCVDIDECALGHCSEERFYY